MKSNLQNSTQSTLSFYKKRGKEKGKRGRVAIPLYPCTYLFLIYKVCRFIYIFQLLITHLPTLPFMKHKVLIYFFYIQRGG